MKNIKNRFVLGIFIGGLIFGSIGFVLADILIPAASISYTSEYTEKTNVQDAITEILNGELTSVSLNGGEPVLKGNLIPVVISDNGTVKKADTRGKWYDYGKKWWANAIELRAGVTDNYAVNATIPESNIRSYFVWIPKYRYKLWNVNNDGNSTGALKGEHSIEIEFNIEDTKSSNTGECTTPITGTGNNKQGTSASTSCSNGKWMTHPAFITMGVTGFWVGKFEIGHKANTTAKAKVAMVPASDVANIVVKPNHYSWTNTSAANYFNTMLSYNTNLNSHMMKNTEWGAVAYLSHSIYGIGTEINNNNYMDNDTNYYIKTGYSANLSTDQHTFPGTYGTSNNSAWNTSIGYTASTTGNISGVYDMAGGSHEYMASFRTGVTNITSFEKRYYDTYGASSSAQDYKYRILGDATGEMGPFKNYKDSDGTSRYHGWHGDYGYFVTSSSPWVRRGGRSNDGVVAGAFYFNFHTEAGFSYVGSRLVLSPTK